MFENKLMNWYDAHESLYFNCEVVLKVVLFSLPSIFEKTRCMMFMKHST